jgi:hypothetical protein
MAVTTVSSSYALLEQPQRLIVGNPCTPTASAIASKDLRFGNGGRDKLCGWESDDTLYDPQDDDYLIGVWEMIFSAAALAVIALF